MTLQLLLSEAPLHPVEIGLIFAVVVAMVVLWFVAKHQRDNLGPEKVPATVDDYVAANGEPIDMVVLDPTRSNELIAVVLVYADTLVIEGRALPREAVTDVTFYNASVPYMNSSYQMVVSTTLPDKPTIKADVGSDAEWAKQVTAQIAQYIQQ